MEVQAKLPGQHIIGRSQPIPYPPYHSKYNPIERCWGALENYWRGEVLDSEAAILGYAGRMTYNGVHPQVQRCSRTMPKASDAVRRSNGV